MIKRISLGEYNFEKYRRMRIKDVEGKAIEKICIKRAEKYVSFKEECILPCSLPRLSH